MISITNNRPIELSTQVKMAWGGAFDPVSALKETMVEPMFTPVNKGHPVSITNNGTDITADDIAQMITDCCGITQEPTTEVVV